MNSLVKRLLTGFTLLFAVLGSYFIFGIEGVRFLSAFFFMVAVYEVYEAVKIKSKKINLTTPILCFLSLALAFSTRHLSYYFLVLFVMSLGLILWAQRKEENITKLIENYFVEVILFLFLGVFGSICLFGISWEALSDVGNESNIKESLNFVAILFIASFGCDVGAYFAGVSMGKKLFYPQISPKKTWAGFVGGLSMSLLVALFYFKFVSQNSSLIVYLLFIALASMASICGDLLMSLVKRSVGIKDFGKVFPGHGGVLDRIDGLLMASPIIYVLVYYI